MAQSVPNTPNLAVGHKANGWEIIGIIDAAAGSYIVKPDASVTADGTFSGLQMVGQFTPPANTVYDSLATVTTGIDFTKCDLIEWQFRLTSDLRTTSSFVPVVIGGTTPTMEVPHGSGQISSYLANATDAAAGILKNVDCHVVAFETVRIRGWANATNGLVVPTGTTVATAYTVTINGGANGSFTGYEGIGPETFYLTMPQDQEIDAFPVVAGVTLRNRQAGMISVDRAVGGGNLALTGITFRNLGVKAKYFGTADNQAGDSAATNGGHTFTQRLARGNGIATANHSTFTLSGGIYRIRFGVTQHYAANAWRNTGLLVNGTEVNNVYSGSDGGNWESGGDLEWIVDAISASQTVQMRRVGNSSNGNCDCWLSIEREEGFALPEGYQTRQACVLTAASGTFIGGATTANIPTDTGQYVGFTIPNGQILQSVTSNNANVTVGAPDPRAGTVFVTAGNGATAATLTPVFVIAPAVKGLATVNAGVAVNIGTIRVMMPTGGNRSWQVQSNTGANLTLQVQNLWSDGGAGSGLVNITATPSTWTYFNSGWTFGGAGQHQTMLINDQTSGRWYNVTCEVGGSYNNCSYGWWEIV